MNTPEAPAPLDRHQVADLGRPSSYHLAILAALSRLPAGRVYFGTANRNKVAATRRRNQLARASRKANR